MNEIDFEIANKKIKAISDLTNVNEILNIFNKKYGHELSILVKNFNNVPFKIKAVYKNNDIYVRECILNTNELNEDDFRFYFKNFKTEKVTLSHLI